VQSRVSVRAGGCLEFVLCAVSEQLRSVALLRAWCPNAKLFLLADQSAEIREPRFHRYKSFSGRASDVVHQLSLAGVGLIWLFKSGLGTTDTPPLCASNLWRQVGSSDYRNCSRESTEVGNLRSSRFCFPFRRQINGAKTTQLARIRPVPDDPLPSRSESASPHSFLDSPR
jgi:hypothetical protein